MLKKEPKRIITQLTWAEIEEVNALFQMAAEEEQKIAVEGEQTKINRKRRAKSA